jgi:hypothetical protein
MEYVVAIVFIGSLSALLLPCSASQRVVWGLCRRALQERNIWGLKSKRGDARCRFVTGCRLVVLITKKIYQVDLGIKKMEE